MEPIVGYRAWLADGDGRLRSLAAQDVWWPERSALAATCPHVFHGLDDTDPGPAPHATDHPCGWHAYFSLETLLSSPAERHGTDRLTLVRGVVEGGGRTHEHRLGWRAQFALPVAIFRFIPADPEIRSRVLLAQYSASERYGIPLIDPKEN